MTGAAQRALAVALVVAAGLAWGLPSDVHRLVARQEDVLLGRYSEAHFVAAALAAALAAPAAIMLWRGVAVREVVLRLALAAGAAWLCFAAFSILSFAPSKQRYLEVPVAALVSEAPVPRAGVVRTRQPSRRFELERTDEPGPARSYWPRPPGLPAERVTLTTDSRGLRNRRSSERYAVVVAGDSFSEGSMVSDDEVWSEQLAVALGEPVHNVAMSGASPRVYLNHLLAFGALGAPRLAVVAIFEGNDFKAHREPLAGPGSERASLGDRLERWRRLAFEDSPLRARAKRWLLGTFGPLRADLPLPPHVGLSWIPAVVEGGSGSQAYAFEPKDLLRLRVRRERFERSPAWTENADVLREIAALARARGQRLLFLYVPSKPHVVMPLLRGRIQPAALRSFLAFQEDDLPPAQQLAEEIYGGLDALEGIFFDLCRADGLDCLSLAGPLRARTAEGVPVYFTYDPHWTRHGHRVAAEAVAAWMRAAGLAGASPSAGG